MRILVLLFVIFSTYQQVMSYPLVANGSFENDTGFVDFPGYVGDKSNPKSISDWSVTWTLIASGNGVWRPDDTAWANNGLNDGGQHLFLQMTAGNTGIVSQVVSGFIPGKRYKLHYEFNVRDYFDMDEPANGFTDNKMTVITTVNGQEVDRLESVGPVEKYRFHTQPWRQRVSASFLAGDEGAYEIRFYFALSPVNPTSLVSASPNDSAVVLDNVWFEPDPPEANTPPLVEPIADQQVPPGQELRVQVVATDTNEPPQTLFYSLDQEAPLGSSISQNGEFFWSVPSDFPGGQYPVNVVVTDNGKPPLETKVTFQIFVSVPQGPSLRIENRGAGTYALMWPAVPGTSYQLEWKGALTEETWKNLGDPLVFSGEVGEFADTPPVTEQQRFYRLMVVSGP